LQPLGTSKVRVSQAVECRHADAELLAPGLIAAMPAVAT
jgi:hypothetical protein